MDCIFCKIAKKEIPSKIIMETENSIAFLDAFPLSQGHTLVIPKKHFAQIQDMSSDMNQKLFDTVHKMITKIDSVMGSTLVLIHNGKDSGQEIMHVHVHLIPRGIDDSGDNLDSMFKNKIKLTDDEIDDLCTKIKSG